MSEDEKAQSTPPGPEVTSTASPQQDESPPGSGPEVVQRTELLQTARAFLNSPQVRHEDITAKRTFSTTNRRIIWNRAIFGLLRGSGIHHWQPEPTQSWAKREPERFIQHCQKRSYY